MKITDQIHEALRKAVDREPNINQFARKIGVPQHTVVRWLDGITKSLSDDSYEKLFPFIKPYFTDTSKGFPLPWNAEIKQDDKANITSTGGGDVHPVQFDKGGVFPVICLAAAVEVNTLTFPIAEYAAEHAEKEQYFPTGRAGDFAIEVTGDSMLPWYPAGTLLLVRPNQRIRSGTRVIAILADGEVIFKVYGEKDGKIGLFSIDNGGKDYVFEKKDFGSIRGLYQVIASVRDEEKLDREMSKAGIRHRWEDKLAKM